MIRKNTLVKNKILSLSTQEFYAFIINNERMLRVDFREATAKAEPKTTTFSIPEQELYRYDPSKTDVEEMLSNAYKDYSSAMIVEGIRSKSERLFERYCETTCIYPTHWYESYIEYKLDKRYKWFECEFFVPSEADSVRDDMWHAASVTITGRVGDVNGYDIAKHTVSKRESPSKQTGLIDISGCDRIYIKFEDAYTSGTPLICVGNPKLYLEE